EMNCVESYKSLKVRGKGVEEREGEVQKHQYILVSFCGRNTTDGGDWGLVQRDYGA
ncbi:hypothetical protein ACJX0J_035772, partial [Zea mays]